MFPSSLLAVSRIFSHCSDGCINDWKSQKAFNSLYVWSDINPAAHINWNTPKWSWKSSIRAFPTCILFLRKTPSLLRAYVKDLKLVDLSIWWKKKKKVPDSRIHTMYPFKLIDLSPVSWWDLTMAWANWGT